MRHLAIRVGSIAQVPSLSPANITAGLLTSAIVASIAIGGAALGKSLLKTKAWPAAVAGGTTAVLGSSLLAYAMARSM